MSLDAKEQGNILFKQKQYAAAAHKFSEAIQLDSRNPVFYGNRAACYFFLRMFPETLMDCHAALQIDPHYRKAWLRKGDAHDELGQYGDSVESYRIALSLFDAHENDSDALRKRIEYVKRKIIDPHHVSFDTLLTLARLNGIVIPNLESIRTSAQIDELRKALFRHPKWSFPIPSSSPNPHPFRIQFYSISPDERIPPPPHSNLERRLGKEQMKMYDSDLRRLLGGCSAYSREVILAEDWEQCTNERRWGTEIGRTHMVYELYCGHGPSEDSRPNRRACRIFERNDLCGPILVTKALYLKVENQLLDLEITPSSSSPRPSFQVARNNSGSVLLGFDTLTLEDLSSEGLCQRMREWESTTTRVTNIRCRH